MNSNKDGSNPSSGFSPVIVGNVALKSEPYGVERSSRPYSAEGLAHALGKATRTAGGFMACCPAHDDKNPSLSITEGKDGKILFHCHAGCSQEDVLSALKARELWEPEPQPVRLQQSVTGKYEYYDHDGILRYWKERLEPGQGGRSKEFRFCHFDQNGKRQLGRGSEPILYREREVHDAKAIIIVEGEKQADLISSWGLAATTLDSGASSPWRSEYEDCFSGKRIVILPDNDPPGRKYAAMIATQLHGKVESLRVVELPDLPEKGDSCDWAMVPGNDKDMLLGIVKATEEWQPSLTVEIDIDKSDALHIGADSTEWQEPCLFGDIETPEISSLLLPSWLGDYAAAVSRNTQTPQGLAVMMGLATSATCLQKRFEVAPYGDDYREPLALWTLTGLPPASRKTAVKSSMTEPLTTWEREQALSMEDEIKAVARIRSVNQKRMENLTRKAAEQADPLERKIIIDEIGKLERETPEELRPPRLMIDDITPERVQGILAENGERAGLISDEGGIFEIMAGLYSGGRANLNVFLQAHAGAPVRVDRQSRVGGHLERPALSSGLTVQPDVISDLSHGGKGRFRGNGLLARFLYCIPKNNIGTRDITRRIPIPESIKAQYQAGIHDLLCIVPLMDNQGRETPRILTLSSDALKAWEAFAQYIENMQGPNGELELIQDWSGKLPGAALRIAGLFHVIEHGAAIPVINQQTIERSLDLCDLLIPHAKAAFELMGDDLTYHDAKYVFQWIRAKDEPSFRQNEALKELRRFRQIDRLEKALKVLTDRHIISVPIRQGSGGRPSTMFLINPALKP